MNLSTSTVVIGDVAVITLSGEVDLSTIPMLHDALSKALTHHPDRWLIIDLDGVTVLDDTGLGVLLGAAASAREAGVDLAVVSNSHRLRERFERSGFSRAVEVRKRLSG
jgi:anti-sigma B factor antagonist